MNSTSHQPNAILSEATSAIIRNYCHKKVLIVPFEKLFKIESR